MNGGGFSDRRERARFGSMVCEYCMDFNRRNRAKGRRNDAL